MNRILTHDKVLKISIVAAGFVPSIVRAADPAAPTCMNPVDAQDPLGSGAVCSKSKSSTENLFGADGFQKIADTLIFLVGAIAVIMLIIGGLRYVISQGNKEQVSSAKDTILYSVIGIIVAILSYAIVHFVTNSLAPTPAAT